MAAPLSPSLPASRQHAELRRVRVRFAGPVQPTPANLFGTGNTDPNVAYVRGLYQAILGRDAKYMIPDASGNLVSEAQYWAEQIDSGALTRQQVAFDIVNSTEHRNLEVNYYYQTILGRSSAGDASGSGVGQ